MSTHYHLTLKRPLLGRDSFGWEQREIPGLVWERFVQKQGVGSAGQRQSRERAETGFPVLFRFIEQYQELEQNEK